MEEVWKDIPGYEGEYQASNLGRIKSLSRLVNHKGRPIRIKERILKPGVQKYGKYKELTRLNVGLHRNGVSKTKAVHKLVLLAFEGPRPKGEEIRHLNGDATDNRLSNLCYGTKRDNRIDMYRYGSRCTRGKFDAEDVLQIRKQLETMTIKEVALLHNVSTSAIRRIKKRETFRWLAEDGSYTE